MYGGGIGWFVKRILLKGNDVTTGFDVSGDVDGIEVVLTDRTTTVTGTVRDARGIGGNDYIVAFFPVGQFEREERARVSGRFGPTQTACIGSKTCRRATISPPPSRRCRCPSEGEWTRHSSKRSDRGDGLKLMEGQTLALNLDLIE